MSGAPLTSTAINADSDAAIAAALNHCRHVARARGRNFYYGLKLTPQPKRAAMYAIYALMRACDDLVDQPVAKNGGAAIGSDGAGVAADDTAVLLERVEQFRQRLRANVGAHDAAGTSADMPASEQLMWTAFRWVMRQYPVDPAHLHGMLDGQKLDLTQRRYGDFPQLYDYCYKVASTVGLTCIEIWGHDGSPAALKMAEERGIALQLTNILRDLVEDARRDRVYLPADELARFGYTTDEFLAAATSGAADERFDRLMAFQIDRACSYYERSAVLEARVETACRPTCWALMRIYRGLLDKIAAQPRRVLTSRVRLSSWQKMGIAFTAARRRGLT